MHALFLLKNSRANDEELRFTLRSVALNWPWITKVWIFGDRPHFMADCPERIEHVPHEYIARVSGFRTPVRNMFLMTYLASLLPELSAEFMLCTDDTAILHPMSLEDASIVRYIEDLKEVKSRGTGLWKDALWRTHDTLKRLGYPSLNFEAHVPSVFSKKQVIEAYFDLRDFVSEDRFYGLLVKTAVYSHTMKNRKFPIVRLKDEQSVAGFHHRPASYEAIELASRGKKFLNFDDDAFDQAMVQYLTTRFPEPSCFENPLAPPPAISPRQESFEGIATSPWTGAFPRRIVVACRNFPALPILLKQLKLLPAESLLHCVGLPQTVAAELDGSRVKISNDLATVIEATKTSSIAIAWDCKPMEERAIQMKVPLLSLNDATFTLGGSGDTTPGTRREFASVSSPAMIIDRLRHLWEGI
ncbi:hypothetical protein Psta_1299 [Pirellula staleyi DSM 6068]|uniref:Uncharacterized protein n=1 Tax=Pirellula staleyi (strain ATCC 27377 / DSM 6068 / ICPB 4128) TaxID=530564 RepID=D2QWA2_PIRSD|nr:hypothetical protein [Pirellula staleyi]ADB15977.1 hypothetical protein Psta_1299 [Pirellula staleyi DSM 6068]